MPQRQAVRESQPPHLMILSVTMGHITNNKLRVRAWRVAQVTGDHSSENVEYSPLSMETSLHRVRIKVLTKEVGWNIRPHEHDIRSSSERAFDGS